MHELWVTCKFRCHALATVLPDASVRAFAANDMMRSSRVIPGPVAKQNCLFSVLKFTDLRCRRQQAGQCREQLEHAYEGAMVE